MCENMVLQKGGLICFGTPRTLADTGAIPCGDLVAFKPTTFIAVPKVCDTIKKAALEKVEKNPIAKFLFGIAFRDKLKAITEGRDTPVWDNLIFSQFKERMGGNIRLFVTGSAPLNEETHQFLRVCIGAPVVQGYGLTETTASGTVQWKGHRFSTCNVGCVNPCGIIKLRDVPELGYKSTDKPFPRGEILMKGYHVAKGYYKNPELTKEYFLEDGWFCTGDVGQWLPDGSLQIIDRKKNLIKMAHGEYIATEALENIYGQSPFVSPNGILVYGDSFKDDLVAIIVPQTSYLQYWAKKNHIEGTLNDLCNHPKVSFFSLKLNGCRSKRQ
jgi:long-chain acyl-CoA synthetase